MTFWKGTLFLVGLATVWLLVSLASQALAPATGESQSWSRHQGTCMPGVTETGYAGIVCDEEDL